MSSSGESTSHSVAEVLLAFAGFILASTALTAAANQLNLRNEKNKKSIKLSLRSPTPTPQVKKETSSSGKAATVPVKTAPHKDTLDEEAMRGKLLEGTAVDGIYLHKIRTLATDFDSVNLPNEGLAKSHGMQKYNKLIGEEDFIINDIVRKPRSNAATDAFVRAGPRKLLHFDPRNVKAAIVTCGGLCPGLNNVIREIVRALHFSYGVETIYGIRGGFHGFHETPGYEPLLLTVENVADCHHQGGTMLASSRGGFDEDIIIAYLLKRGINQVYIIGGDGTHRAADKLAEACIQRKVNISVAGIPKTIDNDVDLIDRSFGFTTSVEAAQAAILSAKIEARCNMPNGVGIVKLMGRSAGFIAVHATLASGDVDLCLVPEVAIQLDGENGCLPHIMQRVAEQGHAVIVVAEGAGEDLLGKSAEVDAGGNRKLPPIGEFMKKQIVDHFKKYDMEATVKYIDPSYMIRSVPANASDSLYCMLLAQNSVHGAMAGYTAFSTGLVNNRVVYIPIPRLVATSPRVMDPAGRTWERVLAVTRQPQHEAAFDASKCTTNDRTMV